MGIYDISQPNTCILQCPRRLLIAKRLILITDLLHLIRHSSPPSFWPSNLLSSMSQRLLIYETDTFVLNRHHFESDLVKQTFTFIPSEYQPWNFIFLSHSSYSGESLWGLTKPYFQRLMIVKKITHFCLVIKKVTNFQKLNPPFKFFPMSDFFNYMIKCTAISFHILSESFNI